MIKIYTYQKCSTCRKATQWLRSQGLAFEEHPIRETPPSKSELESMLNTYGGDLRKLFNTSGLDYRALGLKERLPTMAKKEALQLLAQNGNLVKRPFLLAGSFKSAGFREEDWSVGLT